MAIKFLVSIVLSMVIAGCASQNKSLSSSQLSQAQMQIEEMEKDLQEKNARIDYLEMELERAMINSSKVSLDESAGDLRGNKKVQPTLKNIQKALQSAGFYKGSIDGKIGKQTKTAIRDFQKEKGLSADGMVGKRTWVELQQYLE